ncbi:MAG TPA: YciI family protein [Actinophytocola sp.]|uniref:YciI family protein n=1 Tax=Actinophytocola sp. TaxID=1872138 RepID=UPI002DB82863|nr:YciI family protein [Actinophytocola sp.]HEU5473704.1 YciI family protein [Actinophytocola sp.]
MDGGVMAVFAVTTGKGPNWEHSKGIREQAGWDEHAAFADGLVDRGVVLIGGPIGGRNQDDVALLAVRCADEAELRAVFAADPWAASGVLRIKEVRSWTLWLDGRQAR